MFIKISRGRNITTVNLYIHGSCFKSYTRHVSFGGLSAKFFLSSLNCLAEHKKKNNLHFHTRPLSLTHTLHALIILSHAHTRRVRDAGFSFVALCTSPPILHYPIRFKSPLMRPPERGARISLPLAIPKFRASKDHNCFWKAAFTEAHSLIGSRFGR